MSLTNLPIPLSISVLVVVPFPSPSHPRDLRLYPAIAAPSSPGGWLLRVFLFAFLSAASQVRRLLIIDPLLVPNEISLHVSPLVNQLLRLSVKAGGEEALSSALSPSTTTVGC